MANLADNKQEEEDYSKYFKPKSLFGDPEDLGVLVNITNSEDIKENINDIDAKDNDEDDCEQEACIIDDNDNATEVTYIPKKDFATWSINKIINNKESNFFQLLKAKNYSKKYDENSPFWKFLKTLKNINYDAYVLAVKRKVKYLCTHHEQLVDEMSFDEIASIFIYTTENFYRRLNKSLRKRKDTYAPYCGPLLLALRKLPFEWNKTYRGISSSRVVSTMEKKYKEGAILRFDSFTSTSQKAEEAKKFATEDENQKGCIFEIESGFRGRDITHFSMSQHESEILFSLSSHFIITKIYKEDDIMCFRCKELPFPWNKKTILWVDDRPKNNKDLMESFERKGIMIIPRLSTNGAIEFMDFMMNAINLKEFNEFRIITDMHRFEWENDDKTKEKKEDKQAGINLIKALNDKGYRNKVCIYTNHENETIQSCKDKGIYDTEKIIVTKKESVVRKYAIFLDEK